MNVNQLLILLERENGVAEMNKLKPQDIINSLNLNC